MNDINASIVDQQITGIMERYPDLLVDFKSINNDVNKKKSAIFVLHCMEICLDIDLESARELLTEGGNDIGIDGLHVGEEEDGEFQITIFQGKYKINDLSGKANFPENEIRKILTAVEMLFDPSKVVQLNDKIRPRIEDIRSMIRDGYIPNVKIFLCNNGEKWNEQAQDWINHSNLPEEQIQWIHFNHDGIISMMQRPKKVDEALQLTGQATVEDFTYRRVLIGKIKVSEIAELFRRHGDLLLQRNIRRYLGLHSNRVNSAIHDTLRDKNNRGNFYFFNNGITIICDKFRYNALQRTDHKVNLENMQIINGGQSCKTIQQTLNDPDSFPIYDNTYIMVKIYELAQDDRNFVFDITYATNSQNPVDLKDLKSNDDIQRQLEIGIKELAPAYAYKRQREEGVASPAVITSATVAEAVLAIWREKPHQAKFRRSEHFGKLYNEIFKELNAAQALLAVMIFRKVENARKRPQKRNPPDFLPYASHYIAMLIGKLLLKEIKTELENLNHRNFKENLDALEKKSELFYESAINQIGLALKGCYGDRNISLQQLSATFRRGDLLEMLTPKVIFERYLLDEIQKDENSSLNNGHRE